MNLLKRLKIDEGERLKPYMDSVGKMSIGVGRNLTDRGIRRDEMELMFANDVKEAKAELLKSYYWAGFLDEPRQEVLINMSFNMGLPTLSKFTRTLQAIKNGRYSDAADEMLDSKWARQVGKRAERLSKQMRTGVRQ